MKGEGDFLIMPKTSDPQIANVLRALAALAALAAAAAAGAYDVIKRKREKNRSSGMPRRQIKVERGRQKLGLVAIL